MKDEVNTMSQKSLRPFGMRDKVGYLFGDFGNDFTFILSSSFLMKFYTDVIGVSAGTVGVIMMIARFVDAFTDVAMGRICDRSKPTKSGKFKPWIIRMCGPVAIASFLMYQAWLADINSMTIKIVYLFVTYILWGSVFYTSVNIPYGSMASAISNDPGDRQSLSTFRTMGGALAGGIITVGVPLMAYEKVTVNGAEVEVLAGSRFTLIAGLFSIFAIICYLLCFSLTTERVKSVASQEAFESNSIGRMFANAFKNRALISIICASVVMLLSQLTMQQMAGYVYPSFYGSGKMQSASTVMMGVGFIVSAVAAKPLAKKFGKAEVSVAASLFAGVANLVLYFLRPSNVWVYTAFQAITWLGLGIFSMVCWALITDVIDYSEIKNGIREDGSVYALYSFARKLGQAASSGISGALLELIGYEQSTMFNESVKNGVFDISTLVPAIGLILLGLILWFWYPLKKKQVNDNVAVLAKLHASQADGE